MGAEAIILHRVSRRIAQLRAESGITQEEFAQELGIAVKNFQRLESGKQNLTLLTLSKIARILGVDILDLLHPPAASATSRRAGAEAWTRGLLTAGVELVDEETPGAVPVTSMRSAAGALGAGQVVEARGWGVLQRRRTAPPPGTFIARVFGASMEPRVPDGAWCVFRAPVASSAFGRIVLVAVRDGAEDDAQFLVKKFERSGGRPVRVSLTSLNPQYPSILIDPDRAVPMAELVTVLPGDG